MRKIGTAVATLIEASAQDLWTAFKKAETIEHDGERGAKRVQAVRAFLQAKLPAAYQIADGEAVDFRDTHSGQLDLMILDSSAHTPFLREANPTILPAEAVLAVVEVKSTLSLDEWKKCLQAAERIRKLKPYEKAFVSARTRGEGATDKQPRCFYSVFAYQSNLSSEDWLAKEWGRAEEASVTTGLPLSHIDRVLVLDRGLINPTVGIGKRTGADGAQVLHEWFLNLVNFLDREKRRRDPVDLLLYAGSISRGWVELKPREKPQKLAAQSIPERVARPKERKRTGQRRFRPKANSSRADGPFPRPRRARPTNSEPEP